MDERLEQKLGNLLKLLATIFVAFGWIISSLTLIYYFIISPLVLETTPKVIERIDSEIQYVNSLNVDLTVKLKTLNELEDMKQKYIQILQDTISAQQIISEKIIENIILFALSSFALILLLKDKNRANKDENDSKS